MSASEQIANALKEAMRSKDSLVLDTLRMAKSAIKNREIDKRAPLTDAELFAVLQTLIKQRQESATQYRSGKRDELAQKEEAEIVILRRFLPQALSESELDAIISEAIQALGATDLKQMGVVIKAVMPKVAGRADGARVSQWVKQKLGQKLGG